MVKKATAAAAAAECHYQSGRFAQAAIEIQRCCEEEEGSLLDDDDDVGIILTSRRLGKSSEDGCSSLSPSSSLPCGKSNEDGIDEGKIILATDDNNDDSGNNDNSFDTTTSPHSNTKSAREEHDKNNILRMELIALSPLAHRADLAMCQFRSLSSSSHNNKSSAVNDSTEETTIHGTNNQNDSTNNKINSTSSSSLEHLWKRAKQTNQEYRTALRGAAISLVNTASMFHPNTTNLGGNDDNNKGGGDQYVSIVNAMKSTALSILMAGVAASHLHLYQNKIVDDGSSDKKSSNDDDQRCTNNGNDKAWKVLVHSAVFAADLMIARRDFISRRYNDSNAMNDDENDAATTTSAKRSILEESLHILNQTLFTTTNANAINSSSSTNNGLEKERDAIAMLSFRTALKVAALACGKVILPTVVVEAGGGDTDDETMSRRSSHQPHKKRQRSEAAPNNTADTISSSNNDVWSVTYTTHSNPILHSRERIVDALSFHYAATNYLCDEAKLRNKRMICLEEGRMWEEQSNSGVFGRDDTSSTTTGSVGDGGWCAGYAWKMKHCIEGLDVASLSSSPSQLLSSSPKDVGSTIRSLEKMALSSSSRFACDLLGCIYAKRGEVARALEMFQSSLEYASSVDSDEESAQKRTIVNMALCFLALGEANTPVELLLHLWMTLSGSNSLNGARPRPMEMLLTSDIAKVGVNNAPQDKSSDDHRTKEQLLWMLFHASSLSQDWATCLNCTEEIMNASLSSERVGEYTVVSRIFALLQCRRPSTAQELIRNLIETLMRMKNNADNKLSRLSVELLLVATQMYHADAYLLQERSLDDMGGKEDTPLSFVQSASISLIAIVPQIDASSSLLLELQILMANNQGVALIIEGDSVGALESFRKATQLLKSTLANDRKGLQHLPWLLIPTFFNLSLILLRDGHVEESARSWLLARKYLPCWERAIRGDNESLKKLRDVHTVAINRHVILMAKRGMQREAAVWDQENVMEWVPPSFDAADVNEEQSSLVGGVDASQVIALDVILLRYAVSFAEKKAAASFRRSAGSIGY